MPPGQGEAGEKVVRRRDARLEAVSFFSLSSSPSLPRLNPASSLPPCRWQAQAIVAERVRDERREYLVQFVGYEEPEWAYEVSHALLTRWERSQRAGLQAEIERLREEAVARRACEVDRLAEFQMCSLLAEVHRILRAGRKFSFRNRISARSRHTVRVPCLPVVGRRNRSVERESERAAWNWKRREMEK